MILLHWLDDWDRTIQTECFATEDGAVNRATRAAGRRSVTPSTGAVSYDLFDLGNGRNAYGYDIETVTMSDDPGPDDGTWLRSLKGYDSDWGPATDWYARSEEEVNVIQSLNPSTVARMKQEG